MSESKSSPTTLEALRKLRAQEEPLETLTPRALVDALLDYTIALAEAAENTFELLDIADAKAAAEKHWQQRDTLRAALDAPIPGLTDV